MKRTKHVVCKGGPPLLEQVICEKNSRKHGIKARKCLTEQCAFMCMRSDGHALA